ncbi:MAG: hypothetical protein H0T56_01050 [Pseudaminobacter sp.]|nr:hypothetical protein [Pseudaminobacter sp.]
MRVVSGLALSASLAFFGFAAPAHSAVLPGEEGELARFVPPEHGRRACFARSYDDAHLKKHPQQKVTEIQFRLTYYQYEPDEFWPKGQRSYYFQVLAKLRGQEETLNVIGDCMNSDLPGTLFCGVDDDGGGVTVKRTAKADEILLGLEATGRLRMSVGSDDGEGGFVLEPGEDDKSFLLSETNQESCPDYDDW